MTMSDELPQPLSEAETIDEPIDGGGDVRGAKAPTQADDPASGNGSGGLGGTALDIDDAKNIPRQIGRYHIKRVLGSGGMGTVYEAVQDKPRRTVALKVMRTGIASRSALRRFEYESQLLARLRHPGIAEVYEAGTHDDGGVGAPYFAMEYITGAKRITDYCREKTLNTRQRLELFLLVCEAVHHGHTKGVIHRDLKPDNILADAHGRVKVIDFGVARATDSDLAVTTLQTNVGQLVGTVQYMSPEQVEADPQDLDTRSDVYSLGVILYEMLCGKVPYDVTGMQLVAATRVVREQTATRLSTVHANLRGDIETIVLKALEKQRERRYQSAENLAADIRRFLANEPITARPPSLTYQIRVFTRRHRPLMAAVAAVFVALLIGVVVATALWVRAEEARSIAEGATADAEAARKLAVAARQRAEDEALRAEEEAARAKRSLSLLQQLLIPAGDPTRAAGVRYSVAELLDDFAADLDDQVGGDDLIAAEMHQTLGNAYFYLNQYDKAERHLKRALAVHRDRDAEFTEPVWPLHEMLADVHMRQASYADAAMKYQSLINVSRGALSDEAAKRRLTWMAGYVEAALGAGDAKDAVRTAERLTEAQRTVRVSDLEIADAQLLLGRALVAADEPARAEAPLREAVRVFDRDLSPRDRRRHMARSLLGATLMSQKKYDEALPYLVSGAARAMRQGVDDAASAELVQLGIQMYNKRDDLTLAEQARLTSKLLKAQKLARLGDWDEAKATFENVAEEDANPAHALRQAGEFFARHSRWSEAAEFFAAAAGAEPPQLARAAVDQAPEGVRGDPPTPTDPPANNNVQRSPLEQVDRALVERDRVEATLHAAYLSLKAGDREAYRAYVDGLPAAASLPPDAALSAARLTLLDAPSATAEQADAADALATELAADQRGHAAARRLTRALAAYRREQFDVVREAVEAIDATEDRATVAAGKYLLAMALFKLDQVAAAMDAWREAERIVRQAFPHGAADLGKDWRHWVECWIIRDEARELLDAHRPDPPHRRGRFHQR